MKLVGRNLSPFTRRVAVTLKWYGMPFEQVQINAWQNLDEVRSSNPVGRIPALLLDSGEVLVDSSAIIDHLDEQAEPLRRLTPASGPARREVLRLTAIALGVMEKAAAARYELVMRPAETVHRPWLEHNLGQVHTALAWLDRQLAGPWLTGDTITQADVTTVVMYDFLRLFEESRVDDGMVPAIAAMAASAASLAPFAETRP